MRTRRFLTLLTFAAIAACGNGDGGDASAPETAVRDTDAAAVDTAGAMDTTSAAVPQLPPGFPSDFPLPPDYVVIEGTATNDEAGVFSSAVLSVEASDPAEPFEWYRRALSDAGWQIAAQGQSNGSHTLHATQGESYVDLTVRPDPERPGIVIIDASIWMVEAF